MVVDWWRRKGDCDERSDENGCGEKSDEKVKIMWLMEVMGWL